MSYWSHNPEVYDEIIVAEAVRRGLISEERAATEETWRLAKEITDNPQNLNLCIDAEREYWADRIDEAMMRKEGLKIKEGGR